MNDQRLLMNIRILNAVALLLLSHQVSADTELKMAVERDYQYLESLYHSLHRNP